MTWPPEDDPANLEGGISTGSGIQGGYRRDYTWNERNLLVKSDDKLNTVIYRYGDDGQRALKFTQQSNNETLYFNNFYSVHQVAHEPNHEHGLRVSKHIFVGNSRLVTAMTHADNNGDTTEQTEKRYYYHAEHLQSAQFITNAKGEQYEHIEYTPYGELWIEETAPGIDKLPFRFTGKELDEETGLYYYGARYLDPKYSRWLSGDPALNDYIPKAPIDDEAKKHNENLPGMGGIYNTVNLHVYHYAGNNSVKYTDPDGREDKSSKDFIGYTMGYTVTNIIKHAKISFSSNNRGYSFPWGSIGIPKNDSYQGGYNPDYYTTYQSTEIGRIGLEAHELWHQYQYATDPMAFDKLIIEQAEYFLGIKDPYIYGDSVKNSDILDKINKLSDILTLEGQAQFVGQWNADVYAFISGDKVDMIRLRKEARIIFNSGFWSQAVFDILFINDERM